MQATRWAIGVIGVLWMVSAGLVGQEKTLDRDAAAMRQKMLRGSITPERAWWDLKHYHLAIEVDPEARTISGSNAIRFQVLQPGKKMQIDLQEPLKITRALEGKQELAFEREGNVYWITFAHDLEPGSLHEITLFYGGKPVESSNPPWQGGFSWKRDTQGNHFIATTCQGVGASIWWPNKDHGYDEPDDGVAVSITVPETLTAVSNGRLVKTEHDTDKKTRTFHWEVVNPINNYSINVNIGNYVHFADKYKGKYGELDLDYWVLDHQRKIAETHFKEVPRTIEAFEYWFGKYPFYEDGYKLVVVPYTGMEHQSSVTYGNGFRNGYRGRDLSGTGVGMKFDFIIVHETGHEWFGNNISMKDAADMWIHESFTNYAENLFVEYHFTKKEGHDYVIGCRKQIKNDRPIIGKYNLNQAGSVDMYYKGGNMLHTMRYILRDDDRWRGILRGLNETFWHQTVTTKQVEDYISQEAGIDFKPLFDQYLRTVDIPVFKYQIDGKRMTYCWENVVDRFSYPVRVKINQQWVILTPTKARQSFDSKEPIERVELDPNLYMKTSRETR